MRTTGRVIAISDGRVLLMERWRDGRHYFSIPGGGVELGETPAQAAERELFEETGIRATIGRKLYFVQTPDATHHIFLCEDAVGEPSLHPDSPEAVDHASGKNLFKPRWVPFSEADSLPYGYWQPLKNQLLHDLQQGFGDGTKTIIA